MTTPFTPGCPCARCQSARTPPDSIPQHTLYACPTCGESRCSGAADHRDCATTTTTTEEPPHAR